MKNKNSKKQTRTVQYDHPGRPRHTLKWPKSKKQFTFTDIMDMNGCDTRPGKNFGKALNESGCTMLTVRKNLKADMYILDPKTKEIIRVNPRSEVIKIRIKNKDVTAEPNSETGLGRRALLYCLRINKDSIKAPKASTPKVAKVKVARKARTPKSTSQTPTADVLDKIHAALATPEPAPALTVPAVTIAPEAPAPAPAEVAPAAPVAEPVAEVAPAPAPVAAPVSTLVNS